MGATCSSAGTRVAPSDFEGAHGHKSTHGASKSSAIHIAASTNNVKELIALLDDGKLLATGAINSRDEHNDTALCLAARAGHMAALAELLAYGADVNIPGANQSTPLIIAAVRASTATGRKGGCECVELLASAGADARAVNVFKDSALNVAKKNRLEQLVRILAPLELERLSGRASAHDAARWALDLLPPAGVSHYAYKDPIDVDRANFAIRRARALGAPRARIQDLEQRRDMAPREREHAADTLQTAADGTSCLFFFVRADKLLAHKWDVGETLPSLQELRRARPSWLAVRQIDLEGACNGSYITEYLAVSHRWEDPAQPDPTGKQREALLVYLRAHPKIAYVFFDYSVRAHWICTRALQCGTRVLVQDLVQRRRSNLNHAVAVDATGAAHSVGAVRVHVYAAEHQHALPRMLGPDLGRPQLHVAILDTDGGVALHAGCDGERAVGCTPDGAPLRDHLNA